MADLSATLDGSGDISDNLECPVRHYT